MSSLSKRLPLTILFLVFAAAGIADAWYLALTALTGGTLACSVNGLEGCNVVAKSVYSHLFGIPLGVYGVVFYITIFVVGVLTLVVYKRFVYKGLVGLGLIGLLASICFECIQIFLIHAICIYCLGSAVISLFLCIISYILWKRFAPARVVAVPLM